ncbi:glycosyltransferase family 4 protein [Acinetobacter brisouii]
MIFIGPFPKPIHGQSLATQNIFDFLNSKSIMIKKIDVSSTGVKKIMMHLYACFVILFAGKTSVYISLNSNKGLILNLFLVLAARLRGAKLYLHYHAYDHIRRKTLVLYWLAKCAGKDACHIVLGQTMASDLRESIGFDLNTFILNNSKLIQQSYNITQKKTSVIRLGHLSNLTKEKGLTTTIDTAIYLSNFFSIELYLAGPAESQYVKDEIEKVKLALGDHIKYLGPLYGDDKDKFYRSIDYFIFPSQYKNEAEPLVVLEALAAGVPVIASDVGCIADDITSKSGLSIKVDDYFAEKTKEYISEMEQESNYKHASLNARHRYLELLEISACQLNKLSENMK